MKENEIHINCDLSIFDGRLSYLRPALALLGIFVVFRKSKLYNPKTCILTMTRAQMIEALSDSRGKVADRTVKGWISLLCWNGAVKYKYEKTRADVPGKIMINPYYVFDGSESEFSEAVRRWEVFRSDIQMITPESTATA